MNALLRIALLAIMLFSNSACSGPSRMSACTLMNLDDAKSLIGVDAALQKEQSSDTHCYYRSNDGAAFLHITSPLGHVWMDLKADGKPVKDVGDDAYFYPAGNRLGGNTLVVKKGDMAILINAWARSLSYDVIENRELIHSRSLARRL